MQSQAYYAILPASVRYDHRLKANEKLIYCELTCLCKKEGYCWATNAYFANLYEVSKETVSRWFSSLQDCGYIKICLSSDYDNGRRIILFEEPQYQKSTPIDENVIPPLTEMSSPPMTKKSNIIIQEINNTRLINTPLPPRGKTKSEQSFFTCQEILDNSKLSAEEKAKLGQWLQHKRERKDKYTETGFNALLTEYQNNVKRFGRDAVFKIIEQSMAGGYAGIVWDKLLKQAASQPSTNNPFLKILQEESDEL